MMRSNLLDEQDIASSAAAGNSEAMRQIYCRYAGVLTAAVARYVVDDDAVRDVLPFAVVAALAMALAQGAVRLLHGGLWLSLAVKVSVGAGVYLLLMRLLGAQIMAECVGFLHDKWRRKG